ncbi:hypothetical protein F5X68DRAFT_234562 [Plectosphaerella plurivora]|uniref:Uncharacterized protein n=1 Tax=Plectosphaerella plurivora TaxID=936078 RepID=A0A9P8V4V4_9PEZI|nr:hypothetical protein F5X68DRAFT_234562 [Plectosphaerella plurivora]
MSFQMSASSAGSTPYQGASSPCICPYASYDDRIQAIGRTHVEVVALTAIKLLCSDEAETKKLLQFCPFSRCKEFGHADPRSLVDHIITCRFSSDGETCCASCMSYKNTGSLEKEPAPLDRVPAHPDKDTSGRMDIRKPLRKLSNFIQASIRSSHSSVSSSPAASMISAESPRSSRDFASPRLDELHTPPLHPQTHLYELTDTPIGELGDTSLPFEIGGVETRPVHHPSELAVQVEQVPRRQMLGLTMNLTQGPGPQRRQRRVSPSPPPKLQTHHSTPISYAGHNVHGNWTREAPLTMTNGNSFFGSDFTESPKDIEPDVSANFSANRCFAPVEEMEEDDPLQWFT